MVTELAGGGTDRVSSSITRTLGANQENLSLIGIAHINGIGNALNNVLIGNSGNNVINGSSGNDNMSGGAGNDTYVVSSALDVVTENADEGIDTVQSTISYALGANLENLTLIGAIAINGTGNELDNVIIGNGAANALFGGAGNDTLNGSAGNDTMSGGAGNDTYVVSSTLDVVIENLDEGIDLVMSTVNRTLGANQENLTLIGAGAVNGTGNALDNVITGNGAANTLIGGDGNDLLNGSGGGDVLRGGNGNDTLDGGLGADNMAGGAGDDVYFVGGVLDVVTELAHEGIDTLRSTTSRTLGANQENLELLGAAALNGTGNALDNVITGNSAANILNGGLGNDTLAGGLGNDTLIGGTGADRFVLNTAPGAGNVDTMTDFVSGQDVIALSATVFTAFAGQVGNTVGLSANLTYNAGTGVLAYDADGAGAGAAVDVAVIGSPTHPATLGNDFLIVA
jgi:Ca2+-binding RTX toxin-like protein